MNKNVTIKDIANILGIHHSTVARALRNHPDVNPDTKKLILDRARELNYQPNLFASNFRKSQSNIIGVVVPEIRHDFFASIISEINKAADKIGYLVMICESNENIEQERKNVSALIQNRVAGVIACISQFTESGEAFQRIIDARIPLVFFDRICPEMPVNKVMINFYQGAFLVVEHLIQQGYRYIAHIGGPVQVLGAMERRRGYLDALARYGLSIDERFIIHGSFFPESGIFAAQRLLALSDKMDAIFAVNDEVAIGAMIRVKENGLKIPDDIAIAGFDNDKISGYIDPPLTTIDIQRNIVGQKSIELLVRQLHLTENGDGTIEETIEPRLVIRASTQRRK